MTLPNVKMMSIHPIEVCSLSQPKGRKQNLVNPYSLCTVLLHEMNTEWSSVSDERITVEISDDIVKK